MKIISYKCGDIVFLNEEEKPSRENGPAVVRANGHQQWWLNGKRHREGGPAVVWTNGDQTWYLDGKQISESEHARTTAAMKRTNEPSEFG